MMLSGPRVSQFFLLASSTKGEPTILVPYKCEAHGSIHDCIRDERSLGVVPGGGYIVKAHCMSHLCCCWEGWRRSGQRERYSMSWSYQYWSELTHWCLGGQWFQYGVAELDMVC